MLLESEDRFVTGRTQADNPTDIYRQFRVADLYVCGLWEEETCADTGKICKLRELLSNSGHSCLAVTELILI